MRGTKHDNLAAPCGSQHCKRRPLLPHATPLTGPEDRGGTSQRDNERSPITVAAQRRSNNAGPERSTYPASLRVESKHHRAPASAGVSSLRLHPVEHPGRTSGLELRPGLLPHALSVLRSEGALRARSASVGKREITSCAHGQHIVRNLLQVGGAHLRTVLPSGEATRPSNLSLPPSFRAYPAMGVRQDPSSASRNARSQTTAMRVSSWLSAAK